MQFIVLWCNGSTTDSGPVCLGSNPNKTTILKSMAEVILFLFCIRLENGFALFLFRKSCPAVDFVNS